MFYEERNANNTRPPLRQKSAKHISGKTINKIKFSCCVLLQDQCPGDSVFFVFFFHFAVKNTESPGDWIVRINWGRF